jgi:transcriptional regulator with XRE-family HTH domain
MVTTYRFAGKLPATPDLVARARRRVSHLEASGLSRREIARRAGVAPTSITNLMQPRPRISKPVAVKLAEVR